MGQFIHETTYLRAKISIPQSNSVKFSGFGRTHSPDAAKLKTLEVRVTTNCYPDGSNMLTHVEFRSDVFPAFEDEQRLINPDRWGKRLADFLAYGLREHGFDTGEPTAEDWGWVVPVTNKSFPLWVGCGNYQEYPNGYLCFIEPHKPVVWRLLRRIDTRERVAALQSAIDILLSKHPGISEKRWWTYEDFNGPRR